MAKRKVRLAPGFGIDYERPLDLDGVVDVLTFHNGMPFQFMNGGHRLIRLGWASSHHAFTLLG